MKQIAPFLLLILAACDQGAPTHKPLPASGEEPDRIRVKHVLVAFKGASQAKPEITRSKEEAKKLALDIQERLRNGADVFELATEYSSDPGGGDYVLVNYGRKPSGKEIDRPSFIKPFTAVAFRLKVGEVGFVEYDAVEAAFGYHVIKRLE